jgi:predicted Rossmann fold nucleotide-binding protein DprA/Smf involved in DNA uptake
MARADLSTICPGAVVSRAFPYAPETLELIGNTEILSTPSVGLLCSTHPPGALVLRTFDLFQRIKRTDRTVVGGFHSPMELQCLDLLLEGTARVIVVPARGLASFRLPAAWKARYDEGKLVIVSPFPSRVRRASRALAEQRNFCVAFLAERLFVPFASPGGLTERIALQTAAAGRPVLTFDVPENAALLRHGAGLIESEETNHYLEPQDETFGSE